MSPEYIKSVKDADTDIGILLDKLKRAGIYKDMHFLLITDHGGINKGHGGVTMNEMQVPWAVVGPRIKKLGLIKEFNSNMNTAIVLAKIFGILRLPESWIGNSPNGIFKGHSGKD